MTVPLTILDALLVDETTFESNQLLVHLADTFNHFLESLFRETGFVMSQSTFSMLLLLGPCGISANARLENATILRSNDGCVHMLQFGLVRTLAFLAKYALDLADCSSNVSPEDPLADDVLDDTFQLSLCFELLLVEMSTGGLELLDGLSQTMEVYDKRRACGNRLDPKELQMSCIDNHAQRNILLQVGFQLLRVVRCVERKYNRISNTEGNQTQMFSNGNLEGHVRESSHMRI